ncbi:TIGR02391 family protein [Marinobacterium sp. D7]|uniref:TIGR02391 family protein n=1 Tax=Marinobacterium ramblicola TaxID=2849041 RepID=UPI001C2D5A49|nr:TIGR02391 family protein [Marinobacterium ramblicola]MBV1786682.1 TIGR02391 family protein [Marinobacterium ramblicola]
MTRLAGIDYRGVGGISRHCIDAVVEIIHFGRVINEMKILTSGSAYDCHHALLLNVDNDVDIAIKSGFTSGYSGEGPRSFSYILSVLRKFTQEIDEYIVPHKLLERIDRSALTERDINWLSEQQPVRPQRWHDYIYERHYSIFNVERYFPAEIPLALIDPRLYEIAISFKQNPDNALLAGYRLLERLIKEKSGLTQETGAKLFSKAFQGEDAPLYWGDLDGSEVKGRATLFSSVFMAFRHRRAHQEPDDDIHEDIREFMLLNQLFILEAATKVRTSN